MKKIMIALAAVALAMSAQAASFDWKTGMGGQVYMPGTTTTANGLTAYLFDSAVTSQSAAFAALANGTAVTALAGSLDSAAISAGKINTQTEKITWGQAGDSLSAYFVVVDGNNFYVSTLQTGAADASATTTIQFKEKATSQAALNTSGTYAGAGWYQAVPEPTSGLLMLVGLGALALRRRRA